MLSVFSPYSGLLLVWKVKSQNKGILVLIIRKAALRKYYHTGDIRKKCFVP
mgnify:CR=1 FL=1